VVKKERRKGAEELGRGEKSFETAAGVGRREPDWGATPEREGGGDFYKCPTPRGAKKSKRF